MAEIDRYMIHARVFSELPNFLAGYDIDYDLLAPMVGIEPSIDFSIHRYYQLNKFTKILESAASLTEDSAFGLRYGAMLQSFIGSYWYSFIHAPTLQDSFENLLRYIRLQADFPHVSFRIELNHAEFCWTVSPLLLQKNHYIDFLAAQIIGRTRQLIGHDWRPTCVELARSLPRKTSLYRDLLAPIVRFEKSANIIVFDKDYLALPNPNADPDIYLIACELNNRLLIERPNVDDLETRIREDVIQMLPNELVLHYEARALGMSARVLQRRLAEAGTTFQDLVDETRKTMAKRYLRDTDRSMSEIAHELGFSAVSNFTRACRRWFNASPTECRSQIRSYKNQLY